MKRTLLLIISSDPRASGRPAEAIRIAAGVGTWRKAGVTVYLRDAGVLALSEFPDEFVDEDNFTRYLPIVGELGQPVFVQSGAPLLAEIGQSPVPFREISDAELAGLAASHDHVARF